MKQPFSILTEDYNNSGKQWTQVLTCPATKALERQFGILATISGTTVVELNSDEQDIKIIGKIDDAWTLEKFFALRNDFVKQENKEFHTQIELYEI